MIDAIDQKILSILQENARTSNTEIAQQVGLAASAVFERIRKLERRGVILGYSTQLNPQELGLGLLAFIFVKGQERVGSLTTGKLLAQIPEVLEVHDIAGEDCYLVKVRVANTEALASLLRDKFGVIDSVTSTRTTIVLATLKETASLPVEKQSDPETD